MTKRLSGASISGWLTGQNAPKSKALQIESVELGFLLALGCPLAALFENLEDGVSVKEFTELFPGVRLAQARAVLEFAAKHSLTAA